MASSFGIFDVDAAVSHEPGAASSLPMSRAQFARFLGGKTEAWLVIDQVARVL
jgi:hypothetical protein